MIIYTKNINNRVRYLMHYVFAERLGIDYQLSEKLEEFKASKDFKLNYSSKSLDCYQITPEKLLFETDINSEKPAVKELNGVNVLFPNTDTKLGYDIYAAIFWMISRYEEYQSYESDAHSRFPATESLAFKNNFIKEPIVDQWIQILKQDLKIAYPELAFKKEQYEVHPTIDIDNPWYYKNKGLYRTVGGILRDGLLKDWSSVVERVKVLIGIKPDPHFVFDYMDDLFKSLQLIPKYFLHVGDYAKFDKSIAFHKRDFRLLLSRITYQNSWGVHPSYEAAQNGKLLKKEIKRLEKVSGQSVCNSRHHYLKINIPESYQMLISQGIANDFTMGFADRVGFRAGTSRPFNFFDLSSNESANLRIHPFVVMDGTLKNYEQVPELVVLKELESLIASVKNVNGIFVSLWHNESLSDYKEWKGWRTIYEKMLKISLT